MSEENSISKLVRGVTQYQNAVGPDPEGKKRDIADTVGEGANIQILRGKPEQFLAQQSGFVDRFMVPNLTDTSKSEIIEMLPLDPTKFTHTKKDSVIGYDIADMPWYVSGFVPNFDEDPMMEAITQILDRAVEQLYESASMRNASTAQTLVYQKKPWDHALLRVRDDIAIAVSSERPLKATHAIQALALKQGNDDGAISVFDNDIKFVNHDIDARLSIPVTENRDLVNWKRYSGWFDLKVRFTTAWMCQRMFGEANGYDVLRISLAMRMMGPNAIKNLISKMAVSLSPEFNEYNCAVLAVFQEAMSTIFEQEPDLVPLKTGTTHLHMLTKNYGDVARASNTELMSLYFGGNTEYKGTGSTSYGWLLNGMRDLIDGTVPIDFAMIAIEGSQKRKGQGKKEKGAFELEQLIVRRPFVVGPPTSDAANYVQSDYEEERKVDAFPFRTQIVGGLISNEQTSYFDKRPSERFIIVPKVVNSPRFEFSARGFFEAIKGGNMSEFKGDTAIPVGSYSLDSRGNWNR